MITTERRHLSNFDSYHYYQRELRKVLELHQTDRKNKSLWDFDLVRSALKEGGVRFPQQLIRQFAFDKLGWQRAGYGLTQLYIGDPEVRGSGLLPLQKAIGTIEIARFMHDSESQTHFVRIAGYDHIAGRVVAAKYAIPNARKLIELNISLTLDEYETLHMANNQGARAITTLLPTPVDSPYATAGLITPAMQGQTRSLRDGSPHAYALMLQRSKQNPDHFSFPRVPGLTDWNTKMEHLGIKAKGDNEVATIEFAPPETPEFLVEPWTYALPDRLLAPRK